MNFQGCKISKPGYTGTYKRYETGIEELEAMKADIEIMKKVIEEHSNKLNKTA